jgi:hypothetical protein
VKDVLWEGICEGKPIKITGERVGLDIHVEIETLKEGFLTDLVGGAVTFAKAHPFMTAIALAPWAKLAYDAFKKYQLTKDTALKFYTKDVNKRSDYFKMVRELERTGQYKIVKQGYRDTGYYWELHRRDV